MKSLTLKETIEKIQRPKKEYNEYFQNTLTFWPESWKLFIQRNSNMWKIFHIFVK